MIVVIIDWRIYYGGKIFIVLSVRLCIVSRLVCLFIVIRLFIVVRLFIVIRLCIIIVRLFVIRLWVVILIIWLKYYNDYYVVLNCCCGECCFWWSFCVYGLFLLYCNYSYVSDVYFWYIDLVCLWRVDFGWLWGRMLFYFVLYWWYVRCCLFLFELLKVVWCVLLNVDNRWKKRRKE